MDVEMTNDDYMMVNRKICNIYGMSWNKINNAKRKDIINDWLNYY